MRMGGEKGTPVKVYRDRASDSWAWYAPSVPQSNTGFSSQEEARSDAKQSLDYNGRGTMELDVQTPTVAWYVIYGNVSR